MIAEEIILPILQKTGAFIGWFALEILDYLLFFRKKRAPLVDELPGADASSTRRRKRRGGDIR